MDKHVEENPIQKKYYDLLAQVIYFGGEWPDKDNREFLLRARIFLRFCRKNKLPTVSRRTIAKRLRDKEHRKKIALYITEGLKQGKIIPADKIFS